MNDCSTIYQQQDVTARLCCYFQHRQSFQKFFSGSVSKRHTAHLLLFFTSTSGKWQNEIVKDRSGGLHCEWLLEMSETGREGAGIKLLNAGWKRDEGKEAALLCKLDRAWENMASKTSILPRTVPGEVNLSSSRRQLWEPLPKQVTKRAMLPDANESPNYFRQSIWDWHRRFLRGLTPGAFMPNVDSSLRRNRWTDGWRLGGYGQMDGWMERVKKREKGDGDETRCGLEGGQEGPSVTGKEVQ